jgi:hypothetical protein
MHNGNPLARLSEVAVYHRLLTINDQRVYLLEINYEFIIAFLVALSTKVSKSQTKSPSTKSLPSQCLSPYLNAAQYLTITTSLLHTFKQEEHYVKHL